jgi:hypothetical protein
MDGVYGLINDNVEAVNPGLVYANVQHKGFIAIKATKETHIAEYILVEAEITLSNYTTAREVSKGITAPFFCGSSLVTTNGIQGSLEEQEECGAVEFESERPAVWDIPVPVAEPPMGDALANCDFNACEFKVAASLTEPASEPTPAPAAGAEQPMWKLWLVAVVAVTIFF